MRLSHKIISILELGQQTLLCRWIKYLVDWFPPAAVFFICIFFAVHLLVNFQEDTLFITNAGFGILAIFAGLCFGFAANLDSNSEVKDKILFAGERFCHASVFMILASIVKYAVHLLDGAVISSVSIMVAVSIIKLVLTLVYLGGFLTALINAYSGFYILNSQLLQREFRKNPFVG